MLSGGRRGNWTAVRTGIAVRSANTRTASANPSSVRTGGWMPWISSRSSVIVSTAWTWAWFTRRTRLLGCFLRRGFLQRDASQVQGHRQGSQPLLGAVVQVPLDPPALDVERIDQPQ